MARQATMTVWDVQLGLAVHVKAPNGKYIVIDLGTGTYESGNMSPLSKRSRDNIAYMIITHPHLDHIDDILNFNLNEPKILQRAKSLSNNEVMKDVRYCDRAIDIIHQLRHKMKIIPGIPIIMEGWKFKPSPQMLATIPILIISV